MQSGRTIVRDALPIPLPVRSRDGRANTVEWIVSDEPVAYPAAVAGVFRLIELLEQRAGREVKTPSTEVAIHSSFDLRHPTRFAEDFYVIPLWVDPASGEANIRVFINPMVNFIWLGGLVVVFGAHLAVLPDARERRRLRRQVGGQGHDLEPKATEGSRQHWPRRTSDRQPT